MRAWIGFGRLAAGLGALACIAACGRAAERDGRPNVILVSLDTLRADHVGLYGYGRDTTPFLDRWSRDALVFEHAYTPFPWTLVAHMSMLTGLYPTQHGVTRAKLALNEEIPLLAERLQRAGYHTVGLYFQGWIHPRHGFARGFDAFRAHADAEEAGRQLSEELDGLDERRPFFLFLHLFDVHAGPFVAGDRSMYPSPAPFQELFLPGAAARLPDLRSWDVWDSEHLLDSAQTEALVALYDGGIRHVDTRLSEWFGELERRGLLENTLVIVTADHGEALMQRGKVAGHGDFYDEGLHVPLLVRHPQGLRAGERERAPVHLGDIVPTVLATVGLPADERLPGRSLFGPLSLERALAGGGGPREYVLRWPEKIVREPGQRLLGVDLAADPEELAPHPADLERFARWRGEALGALDWPEPRAAAELTPDEERSMRALGYGGEDEER